MKISISSTLDQLSCEDMDGIRNICVLFIDRIPCFVAHVYSKDLAQHQYINAITTNKPSQKLYSHNIS